MKVAGLLGLIAVSAAGLLVRTATADDTKGGDNEKQLQGTWVCVAGEDDGKKAPGRAIEEAKITLAVTGDKVTLKIGRDDVTVDGTLRPGDPAVSPKAVDLAFTHPGDGRTRATKGIYEIDGDTLKICEGGTRKPERPTEFKTRVGQTLRVYRRAK